MAAALSTYNHLYVSKGHMSFEGLDRDEQPIHRPLLDKHPAKACLHSFPPFEKFISYFRFQVWIRLDGLFLGGETLLELIEMPRACACVSYEAEWGKRKAKC